MTEHIKFEVSFNLDAYDEIRKAVDHEELLNFYSVENREYPTIENYIRGCVMREIETVRILRNLNADDRKLKNRFKELCEKYNVTLDELSEFTNIAPSNLSRILNNKVQPSLESFVKLWHFFQYANISEILYRE